MRALVALALCLVAAPLSAQAPEAAASGAWHALAKTDARAALALIADNHPGAAAEPGDRAFQQRLEAAAAPSPAPGRWPLPGRMVLVTDRLCLSSCLVAADLFRRLGEFHVGEATNVSTRYMEVREIALPSGLRTFSTLQKVAVGADDYGPYAPQRVFPGLMADTDAVKQWVALP